MTATDLDWIGNDNRCYSVCGRYYVRRYYYGRYRPEILSGWCGTVEHRGPAFPTLESAKAYCESDNLMRDM